MVDTRFYDHLGPIALCELLDGLDVICLEGQFADIEIRGAAPLSQAGKAEISFFEGRASKVAKQACKAEVCLASEECAAYAGSDGSVVILSKTPRADFARILDRLYRVRRFVPGDGPVSQQAKIHDSVFIAPGAVIGANAEIGADCRIGPNAVIGPGVRIGKNTKIGSTAVIEFSDIGANCLINNGAVIGASGFGVAMTGAGGVDIPHVGIVWIGDNVSVGCVTTIDRAMFGQTRIGTGTKIDNQCQIAHNVEIGEHCMFAAHVGISGSCIIGDRVIMGGKVGLPDHITIGEGATLVAGTSPIREVPPGEVWSGIPAQPLRQHVQQIVVLKQLLAEKLNKKKQAKTG